MVKFKSILFSFFALFLLIACDSDGDGEIDDLVVECPVVGNITPVDIGTNQCLIGGVLTVDGTLTSNVTWFLNERLQVGTENDNTILTVEGGTVINGSKQ